MPINWRVYGQETVAARVHAAELVGFFKKTVTVGPNESALVIRDGKLEGVLNSGTVEVASFWDNVQRWLTRRENFEVIILDSSPIDVTVFLGQTRKSQDARKESAAGMDSQWASAASSAQSESSAAEQGRERMKSRELGRESDGLLGHTQRASSSFLGSTSGSAMSHASMVGGDENQSLSNSMEFFSLQRDITDITLTAVTKDNEIVSGECRLRLFCESSGSRMLSGLLKGRQAIATWDLTALVRDEILAKALIPTVAECESAQLRGSREFQEKIRSEVELELRNTLATWGLQLSNFFVNWGLTEQEAFEIQKKRALREEDAVRFLHERSIRDMERQKELGLKEIDILQELKLAAEKGDLAIQELLLSASLHRDQLVYDKKLDYKRVDIAIADLEREQFKRGEELRLAIARMEGDLQLDLKRRRVDLDFEDEARRKKLDRELEKDQSGDALAQFQAVQEAKRLREQQQISHQQNQMNLQTAAMQNVMAQAIQQGVADSTALQEMMKQMTMQRALDRSDDKVSALSQADAARNNLETFKDAEGRERQHQINVTSQAAHLMEASKQNLPHTLIQGGGQTPVDVKMHMTDRSLTQAPHNSVAKPRGNVSCRACGKPVQAAWKVCPHCQALEPSGPVCPNCGGSIQSGWKACPACGETLLKQASVCPGCGEVIQAGWKICPACGLSLGSRPDRCTGCGQQVQNNWKICPACGNPLA